MRFLVKPRYTRDQLKHLVWTHGDNFPMRKIRGENYYHPTENPQRFLERNNLTLDEYKIGVREIFITKNQHQILTELWDRVLDRNEIPDTDDP